MNMFAKTFRLSAVCLTGFLLTAADASSFEPGTRVNFVACPMVRDNYIPAWLSQHEGELFYLGPQGDLGTGFYPPQLGHQALIEGVVAEGDRISGGIPLSPVHVSVLPELDINCNTMLPAQNYADPLHHRTPGPSNSHEEEDEAPRAAAPPVLGPNRQFDVTFAFDTSDKLFLRDTVSVARAARFAKEAEAKSVEIVGYRAGAALSNGQTLAERPEIADRRVAMALRMLIHAGVDENSITTRTIDVIGELDGVDDHELRIVRINVQP